MRTIPYSQAFAFIANSYAVNVNDIDDTDSHQLLLPSCQDNEISLSSPECGGIFTITEENNKKVPISYDNELTLFTDNHEKLVIICLQIMHIS